MNLLRKEMTLKKTRVLNVKNMLASSCSLVLIGLFGAFVTPAFAMLSDHTDKRDHIAMSVADGSVEWKLKASNSTSMLRENELIRISASSLPDDLLVGDHLVILVDRKHSKAPAQSLPYQWAKSASLPGQKDLLIQASFEALETKLIRLIKLKNGSLENTTNDRAYAELAVRFGGTLNEKEQFEGGAYHQVSTFELPNDHTIGNKLFKYEGFGWESELVGYRYYFDNRGAIDIFGKQKIGLALKDVGLDGDDYHALDEWGMDVLKVGGSLGLGALGAYANGEVTKVTDFQSSHVNIRNDAIYASATLSATKWRVAGNTYDLQVTYRIAGGQRLTEVIGEADGLKHWASGIVNHVGTDKSKVGAKKIEEGTWQTTAERGSSTWCYRATYGKQSLNDDNLGMALFYPCAKSTLIDTDLNVAVAMQGSVAHYYFLAGWEAENSIFASEQGFTDYVKQTQERLNKQIRVTWQK